MEKYVVQTASGAVRGYERDGRIDYLGIPYAEAPVGERRFKRAVPKAPWEGVYDAKEYGPIPLQYNDGKVMGDEDCLTVNIQRPLTGEKLPVFLWIYGGGYNTGYSSDEMYRGEAFVKDGIVFASFNYRLNVLGFYDFTTYPGCEDFESNCGLSDQILAINWIHDNIAAFGGDPDRITIGGESAGGASTVNMLACPSVKGCFSQAIIQSGLPNCVMTHETARENIDLFLEGMHWTEKDLFHLRRDDPRLFLVGNEYVSAKHQYKNPGMFLPGPIQDDLLPVRPIDAIRSGSAEGVKIIIGTNMHEGTMFVHPENTGFPNSWTMITEMLEKNGAVGSLWDVVDYYHPSSNDDFSIFYEPSHSMSSSIPPLSSSARQSGGDPFIRFATDYAFEVPAIKVALGQKKYENDVWMYRYELVTASGKATGWKASHAFELPAVFVKKDHPFSHFVYDGEAPEVFENISQQMHGDWVRFIKTGEPNPDWGRFEGAVSPVRIYDRECRTEMLDRRILTAVWGDLRFYEK